MTRSLTPIPALVGPERVFCRDFRTRILLIGGLSGRPADVDLALHTLELYAGGGDGLALRIGLSAIPCANPTACVWDVDRKTARAVIRPRVTRLSATSISMN